MSNRLSMEADADMRRVAATGTRAERALALAILELAEQPQHAAPDSAAEQPAAHCRATSSTGRSSGGRDGMSLMMADLEEGA